MKIVEADIGAATVAWLEERGLDVYQEVRAYYGGRIADIVVRMGKTIWVIECKTGLTLSVLEQASQWEGLAHMRSIAVPAPAPTKRRYVKNNNRAFAERVAEKFGIGIFEIYPYGSKFSVTERKRPRIDRWARSTDWLRDRLCDEHKTHALAGASGGGYYTTFKDTSHKVKDFLRDNPGATMKEIIAAVDHHYSSDSTARQVIPTRIKQGAIKDISVDDSKRPYKYSLITGGST